MIAASPVSQRLRRGACARAKRQTAGRGEAKRFDCALRIKVPFFSSPILPEGFDSRTKPQMAETPTVVRPCTLSPVFLSSVVLGFLLTSRNSIRLII